MEDGRIIPQTLSFDIYGISEGGVYTVFSSQRNCGAEAREGVDDGQYVLVLAMGHGTNGAYQIKV